MPVISPARERAVGRLLRLGVRQRTIARRIGISRGTVNAIALGHRRPDKSQHAAMRRPACEEVPPRPGSRCPVCGIEGPVPCVACAAREQKRRRGPAQRRREMVADLLRYGPVVGLDLRPAERARYEQIRGRRAETTP